MNAFEMICRILLVIWSPIVECARVLLLWLAFLTFVVWMSEIIAWIQLSRGK